MQIEVKLLSDLAEALSTASEAIQKLTECFKNIVVSGSRAYDEISARRERRGLVELSAMLIHFGSWSNIRVVRNIDEYLAKTNPSTRDWMAVVGTLNDALHGIRLLLDDVKKQRSDFVREPAYMKICDGLSQRAVILEKLSNLSEPPTKPEELKELKKVNVSYKRLIIDLKNAINELNKYLGEEALNKFSTDELVDYLNKGRM